MSILASRGQEKFNTPLDGFTDLQSCDRLEYITGQNTGGKRRALDIVQYGLSQISTLNVIEANSNKRKIIKTAHGARQNDVIQFTSGQSSGIAIQILSTPDANTMILAANSEFSIAVGDTFDIKRYVIPKYSSDGSIAATSVMQAQSGTYVQDLAVGSGASATFVAPVGAFAALIETDGMNASNIRVTMGGPAPTTTSGIQFQPGRSEMFEGGSNIQYIAESGSAQKFYVQWFIRT